jgi:hypothetical protein
MGNSAEISSQLQETLSRAHGPSRANARRIFPSDINGAAPGPKTRGSRETATPRAHESTAPPGRPRSRQLRGRSCRTNRSSSDAPRHPWRCGTAWSRETRRACPHSSRSTHARLRTETSGRGVILEWPCWNLLCKWECGSLTGGGEPRHTAGGMEWGRRASGSAVGNGHARRLKRRDRCSRGRASEDRPDGPGHEQARPDGVKEHSCWRVVGKASTHIRIGTEADTARGSMTLIYRTNRARVPVT